MLPPVPDWDVIVVGAGNAALAAAVSAREQGAGVQGAAPVRGRVGRSLRLEDGGACDFAAGDQRDRHAAPVRVGVGPGPVACP